MPLRAAAVDLLDLARRQIDWAVPPESRQNTYTATKDFATARPLLFSFIVVQTIFSAMPILFFFTFVFSAFFLVATTAVLFGLFWTGIAILFAVPILGMTSSAALFTWAVGVATSNAGRSAYAAFQQATAANATCETNHPPRSDGNDRPSLTTPATSSSSSSGTLWDKVEDGNTRPSEGPRSKEKAPKHPDPGSDVDALEP